MTDVREPAAHVCLCDPAVERLTRRLQQLTGFRRNLAYRNGDRRVAIKPVELHANVERNDVAVAQRPRRRRNPVDDLFIDRHTQRRRIAAIALERRLRAACAHQLLRQPIQLSRRDPGTDGRFDFREHVRDELIRRPQLLDFGHRTTNDH